MFLVTEGPVTKFLLYLLKVSNLQYLRVGNLITLLLFYSAVAGGGILHRGFLVPTKVQLEIHSTE